MAAINRDLPTRSLRLPGTHGPRSSERLNRSRARASCSIACYCSPRRSLVEPQVRTDFPGHVYQAPAGATIFAMIVLVQKSSLASTIHCSSDTRP